MPNNITDANVFTPTIQTVADGDAANETNFALSPQGLANRTAYLKGEADKFLGARYEITDVGESNTDPCVLSEDFAGAGFSLTASGIELPHAGIWLVSVVLQVAETALTANPIPITLRCATAVDLATAQAGGTEFQIRGTRFSASTGDYVAVNGSQLINVSDTSNYVYLLNSTTSTTLAEVGSTSANKLSLAYAGPPV